MNLKVSLFPVLAFLALTTACSPTPESLTASDDSARAFQRKNITNFELNDFEIILSIDDGPMPNVTPNLLDLLKEENVVGNFYVVGQRVVASPEIMQRMKDEGHVIASHSFTHMNFRNRDLIANPQPAIDEIRRTHEAIKPYMAPDAKLYFRAPGGVWLPEHAEVLNADPEFSRYIGPIHWNIGGITEKNEDGTLKKGADWDCWAKKISPYDCAVGYLNEIHQKKKGMVLVHDRDPRSLEMLRIVIPELKKRGYKFLSMNDVRALDKYQ